MPDEIEELIKQIDYLEKRVDVPDNDPYMGTVKDSLDAEGSEKDMETLLKEFNSDLEGMLDSIGSYRETLKKAKRTI